MDISELQHSIDYVFNDLGLLRHALRHSSYVNEHKLDQRQSNERLEFLGDSVLELTSSEYLYEKYPEKSEGELTKIRASLVSEFPLAEVARQLKIGQYILMGKGEEATGGRERDSVISDAVEAILGAVYLDGGLDNARKFVYSFIMNDIENKKIFYDSKTVLQEIIQKYKLGRLEYVLTEETGPDHDKSYTVNAVLEEKVIGSGSGRTKKRAEQQAAYAAIKKLGKTR